MEKILHRNRTLALGDIAPQIWGKMTAHVIIHSFHKLYGIQSPTSGGVGNWGMRSDPKVSIVQPGDGRDVWQRNCSLLHNAFEIKGTDSEKQWSFLSTACLLYTGTEQNVQGRPGAAVIRTQASAGAKWTEAWPLTHSFQFSRLGFSAWLGKKVKAKDGKTRSARFKMVSEHISSRFSTEFKAFRFWGVFFYWENGTS